MDAQRSGFSGPSESSTALSGRPQRHSHRRGLRTFLIGSGFVTLLSCVIGLQVSLDRDNHPQIGQMASLRILPRGEVLRPILMGHHHLGADLLWLRVVQVLGDRVVTAKDYEWLYHAIDVVTTLDPQYTYAYDAGGTVLAELGLRVDLSNRLLQKGVEANPRVWRLPFVLGFNYFFHLHDYVKAGEYMAQAARIPGHPFYVDTLAARLYVEGGSPALALQYLDAMIRQTAEPQLRAIYIEKYKEVLIVRDLRVLDDAVAEYRRSRGKLPERLKDLVTADLLSGIPDEPFGGEYRLDQQTGEVSSSTHPERLRLYRPDDVRRTQKSI